MYDTSYGSTGVHSVPTLASSSFLPSCEGVWKFPADFNNTSELLYVSQQLINKRLWESSSWYEDYSFGGRTSSIRWDLWPRVDFTKVQLPHLGVGAVVDAGAVYHNAFAERAIDGNVDDNFWSAASTAWPARGYYELELDSDHANTIIGSIEVWNGPWYTENLSDYVVFVSKKPFASKDFNTTLAQARAGNFAMFPVSGLNGKVKKITIGTTGRYIRIQKRNSGHFMLAEVRVIPTGWF